MKKDKKKQVSVANNVDTVIVENNISDFNENNSYNKENINLQKNKKNEFIKKSKYSKHKKTKTNIFKNKYNISYLNFGLNLINNYEIMLLSTILENKIIDNDSKNEIFNIFKNIKIKYLEKVNQVYNSNIKIDNVGKSRKRKINLDNTNEIDKQTITSINNNKSVKTKTNELLENSDEELDNNIIVDDTFNINLSSSDDEENDIQIYNFIDTNSNDNLIS